MDSDAIFFRYSAGFHYTLGALGTTSAHKKFCNSCASAISFLFELIMRRKNQEKQQVCNLLQCKILHTSFPPKVNPSEKLVFLPVKVSELNLWQFLFYDIHHLQDTDTGFFGIPDHL